MMGYVDAWMQGCRDAGMHGCRDAGMQGCRDAGMQTIFSLDKSEKIGYASISPAYARCSHI